MKILLSVALVMVILGGLLKSKKYDYEKIY